MNNYSVSQKNALSVVAIAGIVFALVPVTPALADTTLQGSTTKSKYQATGVKGYFQRHPKVKSATLGAGRRSWRRGSHWADLR